MISIPIDAKICLRGEPVDLCNGFEGLSFAVYNFACAKDCTNAMYFATTS